MWCVLQHKGTFPLPLPVYISHNFNHLSAYHAISSRLSLSLRLRSTLALCSSLIFDPVSLFMFMAYQLSTKIWLIYTISLLLLTNNLDINNRQRVSLLSAILYYINKDIVYVRQSLESDLTTRRLRYLVLVLDPLSSLSLFPTQHQQVQWYCIIGIRRACNALCLQ